MSLYGHEAFACLNACDILHLLLRTSLRFTLRAIPSEVLSFLAVEGSLVYGMDRRSAPKPSGKGIDIYLRHWLAPYSTSLRAAVIITEPL